MKAIEKEFIVGFFVMAILVLGGILFYGYAMEAFQTKTAEFEKLFTPLETYTFNINELLVDPSDPEVMDAAKQDTYYDNSDPEFSFCYDLSRCIEMNLKKGIPCLIDYKVKPATEFRIDMVTGAINNCPQVNIKEELYGGTERKICKYKPIGKYNILREDDIALLDYEPDIHNCYIPNNLGPFNVLNDVKSVNYLYSGRGTEDGYMFENGGSVRIVVTNVSIDKDFDATCSYSMYVCGQNAIAANEYETPVKVFNKIRYLDDSNLYFNETIYWGMPKPNIDTSIEIGTETAIISPVFWVIYTIFNLVNAPPQPTVSNIYGYYPHTYNFTFSSSVPNKTMSLVDAVDAGMWTWSRTYYKVKDKMKYFTGVDPGFNYIYFSHSPIATGEIADVNDISYSTGCWDSQLEGYDVYDRLKVYEDNFQDAEALKHNFLFSNANFMHVEIGYKTSTGNCPVGQKTSNDYGTYCIPNPQYSGPDNNVNLDSLESGIQAGVEENALKQVADTLKSKGTNGIFLVFPYYAEKHPSAVKYLLDQGFTVGIHMHEDWKARTSSMSTSQLTSYIMSEKTRLENAIGKTVTLFSYGPGIQLDEMYGKEKPPDYGILDDNMKKEMFQAVLDAGFTEIQTAKDYKDNGLLPSGLNLIGIGSGLPHSWELHTISGNDATGMGRINDIANGITNGKNLKMTLGIKKVFVTDIIYKIEFSFFGIPFCLPFTDCEYTMTEAIKEKFGLEEFYPRVMLVMDPVTFCSE